MPALDGMRGVAVLMVLTSHSWMSSAFDFWPHIGWSGVELFFVLSGFLITSVLLDAKGAVAYFRTFYARRILRIFPLYYVVVATAFLMVAILPAAFAPQLGIPPGHEWTYWLFLSNISMAAAGTFALSAAGVTWSLAVEEQFYALWAPIVRILERRVLSLLCLGVYLAALAWRFALYGTHGWTLAGLVLLPSQMDALAAGAFIATIAHDEVFRARALQWAPLVLAVSAGGLLLNATRVGTFYSQDSTTWVLSLSLYPLLYASALTLVVLSPNCGLATLLRLPILRTFGRYSYAIYLLHRPLLIGMNLIGLGNLTLPRSAVYGQVAYTGVLLAASLFVGWLSWCLLEQPTQRLKRLFETGERGAEERDTYVLVGYRTMFALGPWRFERPALGLGFKAAASRLTSLQPSSAIALPAVVALSLLVVFSIAPAAAAAQLPIALILLAGACAAALLSISQTGFLTAAALIAVTLSATPHGPYLAAAAMIVVISCGLVRLRSHSPAAQTMQDSHSSQKELS